MDNLEALLLGLLQGLTEYLPVSSSGHLTIGSALFGIEAEENMMFTVAVHVATVLSTLVVLGGEILKIFKGSFHPLGPGKGLARLNEDQRYVLNILFLILALASFVTYFLAKEDFTLFIYVCSAAIFVKLMEFFIRFTNR